MMHRHFFIALGATLTLSAGAQEAPPAPPVEKKPVEQTVKDPSKDAAKKPGSKTLDRMDLDSTAITGNRELPKVLYIVPWKKSGLGDLPGRPSNSLLDEVLAPVDRDVFRRQNEYFAALDAPAPPEQKSPPPSESKSESKPESKTESKPKN